MSHYEETQRASWRSSDSSMATVLMHSGRVALTTIVIGVVCVYIGAVARLQVMRLVATDISTPRVASMVGLAFSAVFMIVVGVAVGRLAGMRRLVPDVLLSTVLVLFIYVGYVLVLAPASSDVTTWSVGLVLTVVPYTIGAAVAAMGDLGSSTTGAQLRGGAWDRASRESNIET